MALPAFHEDAQCALHTTPIHRIAELFLNVEHASNVKDEFLNQEFYNLLSEILKFSKLETLAFDLAA